MKQFDLKEYLKNPNRGIITRSGSPVRIICTDRKTAKDEAPKPIVALIYDVVDKREYCYTYYPDGKHLGIKEQDTDLFFVPEKKTGWINITRISTDTAGDIPYIGTVYPTKEEAIMSHSGVGLVDTIKIEWEE